MLADTSRSGPVIDAQLHEPSVSLDWTGSDPTTRQELLTELQLGLMRAAGVDRAVLFPVDLAWALAASAQFPDHFSVVPMITRAGGLGGIDAARPDLEDLVGEWAATPSVAGIRILLSLPSRNGRPQLAPLDAFHVAIRACERADLPLFMYTPEDLDAPAVVAERHPCLTVVVDHLGLPQPPAYVPDVPPFKQLDRLLRLAAFRNIMVKASGLPSLSERPFPFLDLWPSLHRVIEAFGPDRLMWGSDISRVQGNVGHDIRTAGERPYPGKHNYAESLMYLRDTTELAARDKALILGGTAARLLRWPTTGHATTAS